MEKAYAAVWKAFGGAEASRAEGSGPIVGFWDSAGIRRPKSIDDALKELCPRDQLLGKLTESGESMTLGKLTSLKTQISSVSMFERDCRARHTTRSMAYEKAAAEAEGRTARHEKLSEVLSGIEQSGK